MKLKCRHVRAPNVVLGWACCNCNRYNTYINQHCICCGHCPCYETDTQEGKKALDVLAKERDPVFREQEKKRYDEAFAKAQAIREMKKASGRCWHLREDCITPGWACCKCEEYNGYQNDHCCKCDHAHCYETDSLEGKEAVRYSTVGINPKLVKEPKDELWSEMFARQLAGALWQEFERTEPCLPEHLSDKEFEQLGVPTQNVWLRLAHKALREINTFKMSQRAP